MSLEGLRNGIMALVFLAVLAAAGAIVLDAFQDDILGDIGSNKTTNQSIVWTNGSYVPWNIPNLISVSCSKVYNNKTGGPNAGFANETILPGNYTCNNGGFNLTDFSVSGAFNITYNVLVNYEYVQPDNAYNITGEGLDGISNATSFLDTIGTLMGVAALIAVVIGAFFFSRR